MVSAAASVASVGTLAAAAMPVPQACSIADDSELLKLEELIFDNTRRPRLMMTRIIRLSAIWSEGSQRLYLEFAANYPG
jgi:hypothetical protein